MQELLQCEIHLKQLNSQKDGIGSQRTTEE